MADIKELRTVGTIKEYNKVTIEVKLIECMDHEIRYDIRKYSDGEHQFRGISLDDEAAKNLFVVLGKEFGYLPEDATIESLEEKKNKVKSEFAISEEQKQCIVLSNEPLSTKEFLKNINATIDSGTMRKLSLTNLHKWLYKNGYMKKNTIQVLKNQTQWQLSEKSAEIGIVMCEKLDKETGEITPELRLSAEAQRFVIKNIEDIITI